MRVGRGLFVLLLLFVCSAAFCQTGSVTVNPFKQKVRTRHKYLDVKTYLLEISERFNWSLIMDQDVRSSLKRVKGETVGQVLGNYFADTEFSYKLWNNCLFVAEKNRLASFFEKLPVDATMLPDGKGSNIRLSGVFSGVQIADFCKILRRTTGVEIRPELGLKKNLMIRLIQMPWKTVLIALVRLNNLEMNRSEFSVVIGENK
ncbi:MAG: hypothetical protein ACQETH_01910 [Candidatus Rifleibacteriota bacterium]